jgi:ATP-binding cassette subfamily B protein
VQEALSGIRVLKAYTREATEAERFDDESAEYRRRTIDLALVDAGWRPVFLILVGLSTVLVVWVGGRLVVEGSISIGNIAEYILYVNFMTWPVASLGFIITMVQRASASMIRLQEILDTEPAIRDDERTDERITEIEGAVAFRQVSFRYEEDGPWVLRDVSFRIGAGETLAVVGRTGAGKSTLTEMIPRLIEPDEGLVEIDGHDVRTIPLATLRQHIGVVPQDVFLFSDTVGNNIAFGVSGADDEAIREAAREAELLDNVEDFPDRFETFVGERGITLSGGQKQRTSIARALLRDPSILILDDALSAVDTGTEQRILSHLRARMGRQTLVIVSHRISAVQDADLILVLDDGEVTERGTHDDLLAMDGLYADMHAKQLLEEEIAAL